MIKTAVLGLPRIGPKRELKFALEAYWAGKIGGVELLDAAADLRRQGWLGARAAGIDVIPSGDASLYDQVLDMTWALGLVPERFGTLAAGGVAVDDLPGYFALARGTESARPLEMTKWFDTNYHYLVPELEPGMAPSPRADHWTEPLRQATELGIATRPVLIGPYSYLMLSKGHEDPLSLLPRLTEAYAELISQIVAAGAIEIQIDEPCLVLDGDHAPALRSLAALAEGTPVGIAVATYFAGLDPDLIAALAELPIAELHLDLVRAPGQLEPALAALGGAAQTRLSLGLIDGRNVWIADLDAALDRVDRAVDVLGAKRVRIAPSCSLLHVPYSAAGEEGIEPEVRAWLSFAAEKLAELELLKEAAAGSPEERDGLLEESRERIASRRGSKLTNDSAVRERVGSLRPEHYGRSRPYPERREIQRGRRPLPELPTTTIGSYPQTAEIRAARRDLREGRLDAAAYEAFIEGEIAKVIEFQEQIGLDVLVHGEPERNDMVEYFGEQLSGFAFSANGWVQSYGSRCVKPPILYGDVARSEPMTVRWWRYAQSLTEKPVKGMLTGPVTILQWSFVRDDQPRRETCTQIALAIADEVADLERAGAFAIQVDEAALREGLPLKRDEQDAYSRWAVDCFRLTVAAAAPETQIHTHMCYSEFNEIMEHIVRLDADVISIEASRSGMEVLDAFGGRLEYPNEIGPGVYDIHSPRVPGAEEIERLLALAEQRVGRSRLWVNPDCGLKTRGWAEVDPALRNMVAAAGRRRVAETTAA